MEKKNAQELFDKLSYKKKNVFEASSAEEIKAMYDYAKGYMQYLDNAKTEREATNVSIEMIEKCGFTEYKLGDKLSVGEVTNMYTIVEKMTGADLVVKP